MTDWKSKFRKRNQKIKEDAKFSVEKSLPESGQDLIGDQWQTPPGDYDHESNEEESGFPKFADEDDAPENYISLDELANPASNEKARKKLVSIKELKSTEPLYEDSIKIKSNGIEARFQEFRKPYYLANAGYILMLACFVVLRFSRSSSILLFAVCAIISLFLLLLALIAYLANPTVSVRLDDERNAVMSCSGLFTSFEAKKVIEWDLFYHLHNTKYKRISFLHLELEFEDGCFLSISGRTLESLRNNRAASGAEDLQALGGEYTIQQIAKLLSKARNCKEA